MSSTSGVPRSTRPAPIGEESWFGAFGPTTDNSTLTGESQIGASWQGDSSSAVRAVRTRRGISTTFERIYRAFIAARAALGVALVVTLATASVTTRATPSAARAAMKAR